MTMGDRDYRSLIKNSIDAIGRELDTPIDAKDADTIHLDEAVRCLRRAYFDRTDPLPIERRGFNDLLSGLLRKLGYGSKEGGYDVGGVSLRGRADMIVDDSVILYRSAPEAPQNPHAADMLFLNACLWIFDKTDGVIIYITGDRKETSFSLSKNKKMFEELARRVRVLNDLLKGGKVPILEPSEECSSCQYYNRCYAKEKVGRSVSLTELMGMGKD
ncbi:conserved hypothetical protein [Cenarchaeum symbiosum A]|uniref:DUF83 domain-containing protein n=1 Tax=Cenarchaeum symbiosum (strain A) TaxID=414004 RepID=A0RXL3_CENSY|nr:conserved hypothetical protein [Cenarchaeum symbiosum A]